MTAPVDLKALEAAEKAMTAAPWEQRPNTYAGWVWVTRPLARGSGMIEFFAGIGEKVLRVHSDVDNPIGGQKQDYPQQERDAAGVVVARNSLRALIEHARIAREALENEFPADVGTGYRAHTPKHISEALRRMSALVSDGEDSRG